MNRKYLLAAPALAIVILAANWNAKSDDDQQPVSELDRQIEKNVRPTLDQGRQVFRSDTFGDESFWGDTLKLHRAIEGVQLGGVGPGLSPKTALAVGLKVDVDALPDTLLAALKHGQVNLEDPAVTLELLRNNAVRTHPSVEGSFQFSQRPPKLKGCPSHGQSERQLRPPVLRHS